MDKVTSQDRVCKRTNPSKRDGRVGEARGGSEVPEGSYEWRGSKDPESQDLDPDPLESLLPDRKPHPESVCRTSPFQVRRPDGPRKPD